jgi:archaellum component FlaF (FlaF/FlaG flagellin family)
MTRTQKIIIALTLSLALSLGVGGALAQESNQSEDPGISETQIEEQLGDLVIHSVEWDSSNKTVELVVTWRGSLSTSVSTMELLDPESSSNQIGIDQSRVLPGERTRIRVQLSSTDGVVISTPESIERQEALLLTPNTGGGTQIRLMWGVLLGVLVGVGGAGYAAIREQRSTAEIEQVGGDGGGGWL